MDVVVTARVPAEIKLPESSSAGDGEGALSHDGIASVNANLEAVCIVEGDALDGADFNTALADMRSNDLRLL